MDMDGIFGEPEADPRALPASGVRSLTFTVEHLELMLADARKREKKAFSKV